jgi:dTDP-D-glucose 4,6-dehydratase
VHVEDIASAVLLALDAPARTVSGRAYNVGSEENNRTVGEIAESVAHAVPGSQVKITGETGSDPRSYRVAFSRAEAELGFTARWSVAEGAREVAECYRAHLLNVEDFADRFNRLKRLEALQDRGGVGKDMRVIQATTSASGAVPALV